MKNSDILHLHKRVKYWTLTQEMSAWGLAIYKRIKNIALGKISQLFD